MSWIVARGRMEFGKRSCPQQAEQAKAGTSQQLNKAFGAWMEGRSARLSFFAERRTRPPVPCTEIV